MIGSNRESSMVKIANYLIRVPTNTKMKCEDEISSK